MYNEPSQPASSGGGGWPQRPISMSTAPPPGVWAESLCLFLLLAHNLTIKFAVSTEALTGFKGKATVLPSWLKVLFLGGRKDEGLGNEAVGGGREEGESSYLPTSTCSHRTRSSGQSYADGN